MRTRLLPCLALLTALSACSPTAVTPPAASPSASATASEAPGATPTPATSSAPATTAPSATVAPTATPALLWSNGKELRPYDFKGLGGVYYEEAQNQLYVIDGVDDNVTPRRYLVREFNIDGTFIGAFHLAPTGKDDPDHVDGMAFDRRGLPFYIYRDDDGFQKSSGTNLPSFWGVYELITASVVEPSGLPFHPLTRAGVGTLASDGDTFTLGYLALDPDRAVTTHKVAYSRAEENQQPEALFNIDDPFAPTTLMAASTDGQLYFAGPLPNSGGFRIKRLDAQQHQADFATLDSLPQGMWCDAQGDVYVAFDETSKPAVVRKYKPDGTLIGQTDVKLADGSYLVHISGLTIDEQGHRIVTGNGLDANNKSIQGLFTFTE